MSSLKLRTAISKPNGWSSEGSSHLTSALHSMDEEVERFRVEHTNLLKRTPENHERHEATTSPIFAMPVMKHFKETSTEDDAPPFPQYGLLAGRTEFLQDDDGKSDINEQEDPRLFFNIASPSSTFICGSQGSGKSHTLSCLLENCLAASDASNLPHPLSGVIFHYDTFISDDSGSPCEAAFLSSNANIKVRVLCAPTNLRAIKTTYCRLQNIEVEPLEINQSNLNTKRMLDLMAVKQDDGPMPLYLHTIYRILREMRMEQQESGGSFDYGLFKEKVADSAMTPAQLGPLQQRLDTLESFMPNAQTKDSRYSGNKRGKSVLGNSGNDWTSEPGCLTIVDLSCPCVTPEGACSLFNICLSIFLEQTANIGRVIALDEAHKYMNASAEAITLTETLLSTIRLQRHLGARIVISTQEPTISPALLDLSSVTIVHRFTSPEWLRALEAHLAGAASYAVEDDEESGKGKKPKSLSQQIFTSVMRLRVGEALLFSPSTVTGLEEDEKGLQRLRRLGAGYLKIRVRARLTKDGGKSIMAE